MPTKNANILQLFFFYILDFVLVKFPPPPFLFGHISIVAKITKILVRIPYFKSIVPHNKNFLKKLSYKS